MVDYRSSELWKSTLKARRKDEFESYRERLRVTYDIFWQRATKLAQSISSDLPGLTLHDEAHLTALWDRASQLTGEGYPINPLEAFVFGGALLLHDAGHAVAAYEGGVAEIKATIEYRDAITALLWKRDGNPASDYEIANPPEAFAKSALFRALRRLHAKQAEILATRTFQGHHLIEDIELRENLAQVIGRVAASHHWDRTSLDEKLRPKVQGAPGFMPQEWSIQVLKMAYLLRCADAIQIDQRRAPSFAFAIHSPQGESVLHWLAQQIAQPVIIPDQTGPTALVFTSQSDFGEENADAWWIAHDLIRIANEELQGCYQIMKDSGLPAFTVDRIAGAESPRQLEKHIRTKGWRPVAAEVRVTRVDQIIRLFGGQALYGRDPAVPLRELIQNASDAIRARRSQTKDAWFRGKIVVSLKDSAVNGFCELIVEDDGLGMSEHVLTGPLIEFGKSFWSSAEIQEEFPGLVSSGVRQTGQYGIGFFSTLMVAERIIVTSRRYDEGLEQARTLTFRKGLQLRPLLSEARGTSLGQFSTRVELHIASKVVDELRTVSRVLQSNLKVTLKEVVAHICPCLDCDVWVSESQFREQVEQPVLAHSGKWAELGALEWIRDILYADARADQNIDDYLARLAPLARVIEGPDGLPCGRAAIGFGYIEAGIQSVGGLVSGHSSRAIHNFSLAYVGAIGFESGGPQRQAAGLLGPNVGAWASEQANLIANIEINDFEKYLAAINVAEFGGDPTPLAMILINRQPTTLAKVYDILTKQTVFAIAYGTSGEKALSISMLHYWRDPGYGEGLGWDELDFAVITMEAWSGRRGPDKHYHRIPIQEVPATSSFLDCLERYASSRGRILDYEFEQNALIARYKGSESPRQGLSFGKELRATALKISFR